MRTTLTIEDRLDKALKKIARDSNKSYKQVVNETLQRGLNTPEDAKQKYKLKPSSLGVANYDLTKSLELADRLEDDELVRKLNLRK